MNVLFLGTEGEHAPVDRLRDLAPPMLNRGVSVFYSEDPDDLAPDVLKHYDAILIYGEVGSFGGPVQAQALIDFVRSGGGLVAVHAANRTLQDSTPELADAYRTLIGGLYNSEDDEQSVTTTIVERDHPIMQGFGGFQSSDHPPSHIGFGHTGRTVLERHGDKPWTWVRESGGGRVFYTSWGHGRDTWRNAGFHELLERAIRWTAGQNVQEVLKTREIRDPFEFVEYAVPFPATQRDRERGEKFSSRLPLPLSPADAMGRLIVPGGFRVELFASEPDIRNPLAMNWDEDGRLWVAESYDYPAVLRPTVGEGNDRIVIAEDTTGDGRADNFTVFAEGLNIPTSMTFHNGGVIVQQAPQTLFLKDTTGDGRADHWEVLLEGWRQWDTHAGPSNIRWGFDNRIWGVLGYAGFRGEVGGVQHDFAMGVYHFAPDGSDLHFVRRTNNNTWGFDFSEDGGIFGSTANGNPSFYVPFDASLYDLLPATEPSFAQALSNSFRMIAVSDLWRQADFLGGYTAAAGHGIYTARTYPERYWNRISFVTEPTGRVVGQFTIDPAGSTYTARNPHNLVASDDQWFAPIIAEVGPDGHVWIADWYNYFLQHNPVWWEGQEGSDGNAYDTELRDREHGRIYRVVWEEAADVRPLTLSRASPEELVATLAHENKFWRMHAQRLLVERGQSDVLDSLIALTQNQQVDALGLQPGAIHALWTMHGLGLIQAGSSGNPQALAAAYQALNHPSYAVRRNAIQILPREHPALQVLLDSGALGDPDLRVRLEALVALTTMPVSEAAGEAVFHMLQQAGNLQDRYIRESGEAAATRHIDGFLAAFEQSGITGYTPAEETGNLIRNPSFTELNHEGQPGHWYHRRFGDPPPAVEVVEGAGRNGGSALRVQSEVDPVDGGWAQQVALEGNTRYRISGWVRTENVAGDGAGALLNLHDYQVAHHRTRALRGNSGWERIETTIMSLAEPQTVEVTARLGGFGRATGTAWFDEISVVKLANPSVENLLYDLARDLHDRKIGGVPAPDRSSATESTDVHTVSIGIVPDRMLFDRETVTVAAGQRIRLVLTNNDHMEHNLLIARRDSLNTVGELADRLATEPSARERGFVPDTDDVLHSTPILNPGESFVLEFTAPEQPGEYPYLCTVPGHWRIMNGILLVEASE